MNSLQGNKRLRFHCALAFLVWSLIPHYYLVLHSHEDGERGHAHAGLTREDVESARHGHGHASHSTPVDGPGESQPVEPLDAESALLALLKISDAGEPLHGHIGEDPNLAGEALQADPSVSVSGLPAEATAGYNSPSLPILFPLGARGPPSRLPVPA